MEYLYPEIEPYKTHRLKVSDIHEIYIEEVGNPEGSPVVFLHGGPGGGIHSFYRRFFDPKHYRVILFDQRGAGNSTPHADLRENTTHNLVSDIEVIRKFFKIDKWIVFGGSWGSTLALCYAIHHPASVKALALRGIFLCRPQEIKWFYQEGASNIFPDAWESYRDFIPIDERHDFVKAYYKRLTSEDASIRMAAAKTWSIWEAATSKLFQDEDMMSAFSTDFFAEAFARIECHYFINNIFMPSENFILDNIDKIKNIPGVIVQGRYDVVCPTQSAWDLHKAWSQSQLFIIPDAGHSLSEPGIAKKLIELMDLYKDL
ncbi:MAG: prolyl aminopeptidase [Bdellovibrionaceae bacterium]|nr:prolyl aminopeptidase [Pseudobdellovibrionaceae bacterium]